MIVLTSKGQQSLKAVRCISEIFKDISVFFIDDLPNLEKFEIIFFVVSNWGDEELTPVFEKYLLSIPKDIKKKYIICELGNYFGFEIANGFGCLKLVREYLINILGWEEICVSSIDSFPELDVDDLNKWLKNEVFKNIKV